MTDTSDITGTERFKVMERKLLNGIMTPSMIVAIALRYLDDHAGTRLHDPRVDACQTHICDLVDWVPSLVHENRQNIQK